MKIRNELSRLLGRAAQDAGFRARLFREPLAAAACLGIALNAAQVALLQDFHQRLASAAQVQAADDIPRLVSTPRLLPQPPPAA